MALTSTQAQAMVDRIYEALASRPVGVSYIMDPLGNQQSFESEQALFDSLEKWRKLVQSLTQDEGSGRSAIVLERRRSL